MFYSPCSATAGYRFNCHIPAMGELESLVQLARSDPLKATTHDFLRLMWRAGKGHVDLDAAAKVADCMHRLHLGLPLTDLIPSEEGNPPLTLAHIRPPYGFNTLLALSFRNNDMERAVEAYQAMLGLGYDPDIYSYTVMISVFFAMHRYADAENVYTQLLAKGITPNVVTYTALVRGYGVAMGDLKRAQSVIDEMTSKGLQPELMTYNAMLEGCALIGDLAGGMSTSHPLHQSHHTPNLETVTSWLKLCMAVEKDMASAAFRDLAAGSLSHDALLIADEAIAQCHRGTNLTSSLGEIDRRRKWLTRCFRIPLANGPESRNQSEDAKDNQKGVTGPIRSSVVQNGLANIRKRLAGLGEGQADVTHHEFTDLLNLCRKKKWCDEARLVLHVMQEVGGVGESKETGKSSETTENNEGAESQENGENEENGENDSGFSPTHPHLAPTSVHYHIVLETYANSGRMGAAQAIFDQALGDGVVMDPRTYMLLVKGWLRDGTVSGGTHAMGVYEQLKNAGHTLTMPDYMRLARRMAALGSAVALEDEDESTPSNQAQTQSSHGPSDTFDHPPTPYQSGVSVILGILEDAEAAGVLRKTEEISIYGQNDDENELELRRQMERLFDTCCRAWEETEAVAVVAEKLRGYGWHNERSAVGSLSVLKHCITKAESITHTPSTLNRCKNSIGDGGGVKVACATLQNVLAAGMLNERLTSFWLFCLVEVLLVARRLSEAASKVLTKRRDWLQQLLDLVADPPVEITGVLEECTIMASDWMTHRVEASGAKGLGYELLRCWLDGVKATHHTALAMLAGHLLSFLFVTIRTAEDKSYLDACLSKYLGGNDDNTDKSTAADSKSQDPRFSLADLLRVVIQIGGLGCATEVQQARMIKILLAAGHAWDEAGNQEDLQLLLESLPFTVYAELYSSLGLGIPPTNLPAYIVRSSRTENISNIANFIITKGEKTGKNTDTENGTGCTCRKNCNNCENNREDASKERENEVARCIGGCCNNGSLFGRVLSLHWELGVRLGTWMIENSKRGADAFEIVVGYTGLPEAVVTELMKQNKRQLAAKVARQFNLNDPRENLQAEQLQTQSDIDSDEAPLECHPLPMSEDQILLVDTKSALADMAKFFTDSSTCPKVVGIDTEWKPHSDSPTSLLQIGWLGGAYVVDLLTLTRAGADLDTALTPLLTDMGPLKVGWHIGSDVSRLQRTHPTVSAFQRVSPVCDVTTLQPFIGSNGGETMGLSKAVELTFGLPLDKRYQRSNWDRRPLSRGQVRYAAQDAVCVVELWHHHMQQK